MRSMILIALLSSVGWSQNAYPIHQAAPEEGVAPKPWEAPQGSQRGPQSYDQYRSKDIGSSYHSGYEHHRDRDYKTDPCDELVQKVSRARFQVEQSEDAVQRAEHQLRKAYRYGSDRELRRARYQLQDRREQLIQARQALYRAENALSEARVLASRQDRHHPQVIIQPHRRSKSKLIFQVGL
jgi:hypothetical protein